MNAADRVKDLQNRLQSHASESKREWWEAYLRGAASFRGVSMAHVRAELHGWYRAHRFEEWDPSDQAELALRLIREDYTEDKLAGTVYLQEILLPTGKPPYWELLPAFAELFEQNHLANWNSVDWFCVKVLGPLIERDGEPCARAVGEWRLASTLWQRRASAVGFVNLVQRGDLFPGFRQIVLDSCAALVGSPERFSQTGAAWVLREMSLAEPAAVEAFVRDHATDMSREAMVNAVKRLPETRRKSILAVHRASGRKAGFE